MRRPRITVLVHGGPGSIEAVRARGLTRGAPPGSVAFEFRQGSRGATLRRWFQALRQGRPDLVYVLNTALPGAPLAALGRTLFGFPYVLDTGDVIHEMARRSGIGAGWRLPLLWAIERLAWRRADTVVVRGTRHAQYLGGLGIRSALIRDGYADAQDVPEESVAALRRSLGLEGHLVVGVMGSLVWSPRLGICYGWDLLRALPLLADLPIKAVVIGDGNGKPWLEAEAARLGVRDRLVFTGRIPYETVPAHMRLFDIALSTQTNNLPGQVRTTGKVPEYMAAGCFILASQVGEAELLLPREMLVPFAGEVDPEYPARLAARIRHLALHPEEREIRRTLPALASEKCSYEVLSGEWLRVVNEVLQRHGKPGL